MLSIHPQSVVLLLACCVVAGTLACGTPSRDSTLHDDGTPDWVDAATRTRGAEPAGSTLFSEAPPPPELDANAIALEERALGELVRVRKDEILARYLDAPFPSLESGDPATRCWAYAGFALAAYRAGDRLATADRYLREIDRELGVAPEGPADASPCYFALPLLMRIYFDPDASTALTQEVHDILLRQMHVYIERRSRVVTAHASTWRIEMSENHDAIQKAIFLLASRALMEAPAPYGRDLELADGYDIATHYESWLEFWMRYFADRAREGIGCEIASPVYAKHTLASYLGVHDFSGSAALEQRSGDFLELYWADVAQEFQPATGVRGGAETRVYKDAYLKLGTRQSTRPAAYLYGWHDDPPASIHPLTLITAASEFAPSAMVHAQATRRGEDFVYRTRRCGRGDVRRIDDEPHYRMRFDGGRGSHLLRTSHVTEAYVLGALTFDPDEPYNALAGQNRSMGVSFSSAPNDRIVVHGIGRDRAGTVGYDEITGVVAEDVLVVARDPMNRRSAGLRIFVSTGTLWEARSEAGPWWFSRTDSAYVGIRIPEAGYRVVEEAHGFMLELEDSWTPVVLQLGRPEVDGSFDAFRARILEERFVQLREARSVRKGTLSSDDYERVASRIHYRSLRGDVLTVWSHNRHVPEVNGRPVDLLPPLTYDSPYLASRYRSDRVALFHPDFGLRELDFGTTTGSE